MNVICQVVRTLVLSVGIAAIGIAGAAHAARADTLVAPAVTAGSIGGDDAPRYHWYRWRDGNGWHRRWVPFGWSVPADEWPPARTFGRGAAYRSPTEVAPQSLRRGGERGANLPRTQSR